MKEMMVRQVDGDIKDFKGFKEAKNEATLIGKRKNVETTDESSGGDQRKNNGDNKTYRFA